MTHILPPVQVLLILNLITLQILAGKNTCVASVSNQNPLILKQSLFPQPIYTISQIVHTSQADVVMLEAGHDQGLRTGMFLKIQRNQTPIGEIQLVAVEQKKSAALIIKLTKNQILRPGDIAQIKTLKISKTSSL
jgi:hypothetical protein